MDYSSLKVTELRAILKERGIPPAGLKLKADIVDRLIQDDADKQATAKPDDVTRSVAPVDASSDAPGTDEIRLKTEAPAGSVASPALSDRPLAADQNIDSSHDSIANQHLAAESHVTESVPAAVDGTNENETSPVHVPGEPTAPVKFEKSSSVEDNRKRKASPEPSTSPDPKRTKIAESAQSTAQGNDVEIVKDDTDMTEVPLQAHGAEETMKEGTYEDRRVTPALHHATAALYISNLVRPINVSALQTHLLALATSDGSSSDGVLKKLHVDSFRTHAFALFGSSDAAVRARRALHDALWPTEPTRKPLWVDFLPDEKCIDFIGEEQSSADAGKIKRWQVEYHTSPDGTSVELVDISQPPARTHSPSSRSPSSVPQPRREKPSKAPTVSNPQLQSLDERFRSTTSKPKLYWLPVTDEAAEVRRSALQKSTSRSWDARRDFEKFGASVAGSGLDQLRRYTFEDGRVVDGGVEWTGFAGNGGGRGGYGGARRERGSWSGRYGGRGGGDRYVP